ncbi:replication fork protection component Swi3-domain-containing protein [Blakeslea trispora]|nr:replication fork protection component Swi3-domain-containing protein [Blakeslea trispora]
MSEFDDLVLDDYGLDSEFSKQLEGLTNPSIETQDAEENKKTTLKRPKLDDERLLGEKGILALKNRAQYLNFRGKGHEEQDLKDLMQFYMFWANNLFPKLKFQDFAKRVTKPASTAAVKSQIKAWQDEFKERTEARLEVERELAHESEDREEEEEENASSEDDNRPLFFPLSNPLPSNTPKKVIRPPSKERPNSPKKRKMVSLDDSEEDEPSLKSRRDMLNALQERRRQREEAKKKEEEREAQEERARRAAELERSAEDLSREYLGEDVELALSDHELSTMNEASFSDNELIQDLDTTHETE